MALGMEQRNGCCTAPSHPGAGPGPDLMAPPKERSRDTLKGRSLEGTCQHLEQEQLGPGDKENSYRVVSMGGSSFKSVMKQAGVTPGPRSYGRGLHSHC